MKQTKLVRIYNPGGSISVGKLRELVKATYKAGIKTLHIGSRQNIIIKADGTLQYTELTNYLESKDIPFNNHEYTHPNIISSLTTVGILPTTPWVNEGVFYDIFESFDYKPKLKVNIVDPEQSLIPVFSGELNFIASSKEEHWYLYLNIDSEQGPREWPTLIHSSSGAEVCKRIEDVILSNFNITIDALINDVSDTLNYTSLANLTPFQPKKSSLPYYEGLHIFGQKCWLGISRRANDYPIEFMDMVVALAKKANIGKIHLTPWRSMLIKNIPLDHIPMWEGLLGEFNINTNHSSLEMNWQVKNLEQWCLNLKDFLFKQFDKLNVRTEGVTFSIGNSGDIATSIMIDRVKGILPFLDQYKVSYRKNFDPNEHEVITFVDKVAKKELPDTLLYLCKQYYKGAEKILSKVESSKPKKKEKQEDLNIHQCPDCLTVYDPMMGAPEVGVIPGTSFEDLSQDFLCPTCENPKSSFKKVTSLKDYAKIA